MKRATKTAAKAKGPKYAKRTCGLCHKPTTEYLFLTPTVGLRMDGKIGNAILANEKMVVCSDDLKRLSVRKKEVRA